MTENLPDQALIPLLQAMMINLAAMEKELGPFSRIDTKLWQRTVAQKITTRLNQDFPFITAICGGGSSGKSTLFNTLIREKVSPMGGVAGLNRRTLAAVPKTIAEDDSFRSALEAVFKEPLEPLVSANALTHPGAPLYVETDNLPNRLILLDTPDFDTGANHTFANRQLAENALESADILIYIFTNANYNNRENSRFMSQVLTTIGRRKTFFVYRVDPGFSDEDVKAHAATVAEHLYDKNGSAEILGVYRVDENNQVADGQVPMTVTPVSPNQPPLETALEEINPRQIRFDLAHTVLTDALNQAQQITQCADYSNTALAISRDGLKSAQSVAAKEALKHLPVEALVKRFAQIWTHSDPGYIKMMRKTGRVLDLPVKGIVKSYRWFKGKPTPKKPVAAWETLSDLKIEANLLTAAATLFKQAVSHCITIELPTSGPISQKMRATIGEMTNTPNQHCQPLQGEMSATPKAGQLELTIPAHPVVADLQETLRQTTWKSISQQLSEQKAALTAINQQVDGDLQTLADQLRGQMDLWHRVREGFSAFLNILPATAAVTYILSTGDPVGAVGIKVKLASLFGLHDLYALVALPTTSGIHKADRQQLEQMLAPVAQTWLNSKLDEIQTLFETEITGPILERCEKSGTAAKDHIDAFEKGIHSCRNLLKQA